MSTLRAKIDYGFTEAMTPQGHIGVQVWINQGMYEGEVDDGEVECPLHGALFDITTGEAQSLPATRPVPSYRADVRDGAIFLQLETT